MLVIKLSSASDCQPGHVTELARSKPRRRCLYLKGYCEHLVIEMREKKTQAKRTH